MKKYKRLLVVAFTCYLTLSVLFPHASALEENCLTSSFQAEGISITEVLHVLSNKQNVSLLHKIDNKIFCVMNGNTLTMYNDTNKRIENLYTSNCEIKYYLTDGDKGAMVGNMPPMDSNGIPYTDAKSRPGLHWLGNYYYIDFSNGKVQAVNNPNLMMDVINSFRGSTNGVSYTTKINGKQIPWSAYPNGSTFSGSCGGATQCYGFALKVHEYLYGSYDNAVEISVNQNLSAREIVNRYAPGTFLRMTTASGSNHAMIYIGHDSRHVYVYHSNWDNQNTVYVTAFDWNTFDSTFGKLLFVRYHVHDFSSWQSISSKYHSRTCSSCGYKETSPHVYDDTTRKCIACGKTMPFRLHDSLEKK